MSLAQALEAVQRKTDDLYATTISDEIEVIFRLPSIKKAEQYAVLLRIANDYSFQVIIYEHIFKNYVEDSYLREYADLHAGVVESTAKLILYLSGVAEESVAYTEQLFADFRVETNKILLFMQRTICSVFTGYTFESLELINYQRLVNIFIQAEQVLMDRGIIETVHKFEDPNAEKESSIKSLQEQIRMDQRDFNSYDRPSAPDPRMQKLREQAIDRAASEERKYRKNIGG